MARGTIITTTTKDGTKRYRTIIRVNGRQQWRTWDRKKDAENHLDNLSPEIRDGTYRDLKKATFGEYAEIWKGINLNAPPLKPATLNSYASILESHLLPEFRSFPMAAISHDEISLFRTRLLKGSEGRKALKAKTIRNILTLLGVILKEAKKAHYIRFNPMADVDLPDVPKGNKGRALKPEEFNAILEECSERLRPIFMMSALAGMRRGETLGLMWEHVDFESNVIKVRQQLFMHYGKYLKPEEGSPGYSFISPKSAESVRDIDLSPALRKELLALFMKGSKKGLVFNCGGNPLDADNLVKRDFADALKAADAKRISRGLPAIGKVRWHDLRHTFGSWKIDQGENLYYVMRQMGHSSIQVTITCYAHQLKERNPEAAAKTDEMIFGV